MKKSLFRLVGKFLIRKGPLINTGASARWEDAFRPVQLFQEFAANQGKPLKLLRFRSTPLHRAKALVLLRASLNDRQVGGLRCALLVSLLAGLLRQASADVTFTNDTAISFNNTNFDGANITVTNCTVTVDGAHSFASLLVLNGGRVTHSTGTNGLLESPFYVTNEQQVLAGLNPVTLYSNNIVLTSVVVRDVTRTITYTNGADYTLGYDTNSLVLLQRTDTSAIPDGATVSVDYVSEGPQVPTGLNLNLAGDVTVSAGGAIVADGRGYWNGTASGPGAGGTLNNSGGGGGYGGYGGSSATNAPGGNAHGSILQPVDKGSGGGSGPAGPGGPGGGLIQISVGGTLTVNGNLTANGMSATNDRSGGGSGGGIWVTARTIAGAGVIRADGGAGEPVVGGGGGGGRIALYYTNAALSGVVSARGGAGAIRGGAGTLYTKGPLSTVGDVVVDNGGRQGTNTVLTASEPFNVIVQGGAVISLPFAQTIGSLTLNSNSGLWMSISPLTINGDAAIHAGATITADGTGYPAGSGPGIGASSTVPAYGVTGGGGGYGGRGAPSAAGVAGGVAYGSIPQPSDLGSSGGGGTGTPPYSSGGSGGGAVVLNVGGTLAIDGRVSADGLPGVGQGSGGGSGGRVLLTVGTLSGAGSISATGGAGNDFGGGGGGGRIAIYYQTNNFTGAMKAFGASGGGGYGGAGTIYTKGLSQPVGDVLVDNGSNRGASTPVTAPEAFYLTAEGGANLVAAAALTVRQLVIGANTTLLLSNYSLTVSDSADIQPGGVVSVDGEGYGSGAGIGAGRTVFYEPQGQAGIYTGGGGAHGGYGAASALGAPGGISYDYGLSPSSWGSGGGSGTANFSLGGGSGGGAMRVIVAGLLQVDGQLSANGLSGTTNNSGGGAGGSIFMTVAGLSGSGIISANGGAGLGLGGGGGGGRIAIADTSNFFTGTITAYGGGGTNFGGAGTIYFHGLPLVAQAIIDNGGNRGTNTDFSALTGGGTLDVVVQNGGVLTNLSSPALRSLFIGSNSGAFVANATLTVISNVTIQAGGSLTSDGKGFPSSSGPGFGRTYLNAAGGGGNGGYGAAGGSAQAYGGVASGLAYQSQALGSGGGGVGTNQGGAGGGFIRLSVNGVLQVDGTLSANGAPGAGPGSGGGSGGSLILSAGTLTGSGVISANGGSASGLGGGGGGGRITVLVPAGQPPLGTNAFAGQLSAYGGSGFGRGGAGTVYSRGFNQNYALILVDNGGVPGTNTIATDVGTFDLTIANAGSFVQPSLGLSVHNLLVGSNSFLIISNQISSSQSLSILGNASVQAGGAITADHRGYGGGKGLGAGYNQNPRGGGGYGGAGGGNPPGYGPAYGLLQSPTDPGSGGGNGSGAVFAPLGGAGGGATHLSVGGVLAVDGRISADGGDGDTASGGGSGGAVWLTVSGLSGTGTISANGGAGNGSGGGGGGGRIAITYTSNTFTGTLSSRGGGGRAYGGAGTIYTKANNQAAGMVVLDNNGVPGTNSSLGALSGTPFDLVLKSGASLVPNPGGTTVRSLTLASNAWMVFLGQGTTLGVTGDASIPAGGGIIADGTGWVGSQGPGPGGTSITVYGQTGGGGGHAGYGAASGPGSAGGNSYGFPENPLTSGSGGGSGVGVQPYNLGGAGGGAISLNVAGTLFNNGRISANGALGPAQGSGGGAGGSVLLSVGTVTGTGIISANGGAGNGLGGGGGGGRVSINYNSNLFIGAIAARGGGGANWGGAGTIYTSNYNQLSGQVTIDNGGNMGTNTLFVPTKTYDLTVQGGAVASLGTGGNVTVSNLTIGSLGTLLADRTASMLDVLVLANASIATNGAILADGHGYVMGNGPGAGASTNSAGSGAGYGGAGGASYDLPGGSAYGSPLQPTDWGSGGGAGYGGFSSGSDGGGALRLTVAGTLTVSGLVSANGNPGTQDDSGGGSGGSILLSAGLLKGDGLISASGGAGQLYSGGGGAGGRIAIYSQTNRFTGQTIADGGFGYFDGQDGSIFFSGTIPPPAVISQTPTGIVSNGVSLISVSFSTPVNPATAYNVSFTLNTPAGSLTEQSGQGPVTILVTDPETVQFVFPLQTSAGNYSFTIGKQIQDLFGQPLSQVYTGAFTVSVPVIQGTVTNSLGQPVPGVVLQPSLGSPATTDASGHYAVGVLPGSFPTIYPSKAGLMFVPGSRSYTSVTSSLSNENYLAVTTIAPTLTAQIQGSYLVNSWYGYLGVTYTAYYSTDLVNWYPYTGPLPGTNGPVQVLWRSDITPATFFRVQAAN